jgi:hypothetical protein
MPMTTTRGVDPAELCALESPLGASYRLCSAPDFSPGKGREPLLDVIVGKASRFTFLGYGTGHIGSCLMPPPRRRWYTLGHFPVAFPPYPELV